MGGRAHVVTRLLTRHIMIGAWPSSKVSSFSKHMIIVGNVKSRGRGRFCLGTRRNTKKLGMPSSLPSLAATSTTDGAAVTEDATTTTTGAKKKGDEVEEAVAPPAPSKKMWAVVSNIFSVFCP